MIARRIEPIPKPSTPALAAATADGLPMPRRGWAALAIWLAMAITVLDSTIANVALPAIAQEFGARPAAALWVIHGYQLAIVMSLLSFSALGEMVGYRRVYRFGIVLFTIASVAAALAPGMGWLIAMRAVQGLGAAAIMSVNGALVRFTFPTRHLGRALGINALVIAISATIAPPITGITLAFASWRWLFGINLLLGGVSLAAGWRALPDARGAARRLDAISAALSAGAAASLFAVTALGGERHDARLIILGLALFAGLGGALITRARAQPQPLLPIDLMRVPALAHAYLASLCGFAGQMLVLVALPFYLRLRFGYAPLTIGAVMVAMPLGLGLAAPLAGGRADQPGRAPLAWAGLPLAALGMLALGLASGGVTLALCGLISGIGFGMFQAPNNRVMINAAPRARSGAAAGMLALARLTGQLLGVLAAAMLFRWGSPASPLFCVVAAGFALLGALLRRGP